MSDTVPSTSEFDQGAPDVLAPGEGELILDLEGYEGPLDVLLTLARDQKVDLRRISMVALVDQYLVFVQQARRLRLELAADYLVMAAWLAYLKSRLMAHPRLGVDTFNRGRSEGALVLRKTKWDVQLYELLKAYGDQMRPKDADAYHIRAMQFYSVEEALERLERMIGIAIDWASLAAFLPPGLTDPMKRRSAVAATFVATLQLAKDGVVQLRQTESFGPLMLRRNAGEEAPQT